MPNDTVRMRGALALGFAALCATGTIRAGGPLFTEVAGALITQPCGGTGCWTQGVQLVDIDADADLDILMSNYPGFFNETAAPQPMAVYRNDGGFSFVDISATSVAGYNGRARQLAAGDVDGNSSPDLYIAQVDGGTHVLLLNQGGGVFAAGATPRLPAVSPLAAATRMADVDGDGDLDIVIITGYAAATIGGLVYLNDGAGFFATLAAAIPIVQGNHASNVEVLDVDRDFDLDLYVLPRAGSIGSLLLNDGSGHFAIGGTIDAPTDDEHFTPSACDVENDGDLDIWIDGGGPGTAEELLVNNGSNTLTARAAVQVTGNPSADDNAVLCADIDNDGDQDGVVLSLSTAERLLRNNGSGQFAFETAQFAGTADCTLAGAFGDLNADGRLDLVTGEGECASLDRVYTGGSGVPVDIRAPTIVAVQAVTPSPTPVARFAVSDAANAASGAPLLRAFVVLGALPGGSEVPARFVGGDVYFASLPTLAAGNASFSACAEDQRGNRACSPVQTYAAPTSEIFLSGFEAVP